jgi:hypothetical protein
MSGRDGAFADDGVRTEDVAEPEIFYPAVFSRRGMIESTTVEMRLRTQGNSRYRDVDLRMG